LYDRIDIKRNNGVQAFIVLFTYLEKQLSKLNWVVVVVVVVMVVMDAALREAKLVLRFLLTTPWKPEIR
jgi:hypothetical protein